MVCRADRVVGPLCWRRMIIFMDLADSESSVTNPRTVIDVCFRGVFADSKAGGAILYYHYGRACV